MAMKESINYRYWVLATISGSVMVFVVLLSAYFGRRSGEIDILYIGTFLSVLAISWTYAEIANFIRYKEQHGMDIELKSMKGQPGNGLKTIRFFSLYVATIIILLLATVLEI